MLSWQEASSEVPDGTGAPDPSGLNKRPKDKSISPGLDLLWKGPHSDPVSPPGTLGSE